MKLHDVWVEQQKATGHEIIMGITKAKNTASIISDAFYMYLLLTPVILQSTEKPCTVRPVRLLLEHSAHTVYEMLVIFIAVQP